MPTVEELTNEGRLVRFRPNLLPGEVEHRCLYMMPRAMRFCTDRLPALHSDGFDPGAKTPLEQLDDEMTDFTCLPDYPRLMAPKALDHLGDGVWELRTADLRVFGWFWRSGCFIAADIGVTADLKGGVVTYAGYARQTCYDRSMLGLDPPAFIIGRIADVL